MTRAAYRVHQMIQDLNGDPAAAKKFADDAEATFDAYGLTEDERELLRQGTPAALIELGVHPNLQMKYLKLRKAPMPGGGGAGPMAYYFEKLGIGS